MDEENKVEAPVESEVTEEAETTEVPTEEQK